MGSAISFWFDIILEWKLSTKKEEIKMKRENENSSICIWWKTGIIGGIGLEN